MADLVDQLGLAQPNVSKHLRRAADAGLVTVRPDGARQLVPGPAEPLVELDAWLAPYRRLWTSALDDLDAHLDEMEDLDDRSLDGDLLDADGRGGAPVRPPLAHPPEKVWRAITESEHLQHWLPCDIVGERAAGASVELPFWPAHVEAYGLDMTPSLSGEIRVWDPPSVFEWSWSTDLLRWELAPDGDGDGPHLHHLVRRGRPPGARRPAAGYHVCLDQLVELVATGTVAEPLVAADVGPLEERYREASGRD